MNRTKEDIESQINELELTIIDLQDELAQLEDDRIAREITQCNKEQSERFARYEEI